MGRVHVIVFLVLIISSLRLIYLIAREEMKQPVTQLRDNELSKENFWRRNKWRSLESKRQIEIIVLLLVFLTSVVASHLLA